MFWIFKGIALNYEIDSAKNSMFSDPMIKKFLVNWSRQKILCFGSVKDCNVGTSHQRGRKFSVLDPRSCIIAGRISCRTV